MDMNEQGKRAHRCCFTGHRPEKLTITEAEALLRLESTIRQAISDGYTEFITGMARGVDIWAGEIVIRLRDEGRPIKLICASPFSGFEDVWNEEWQERYHRLLEEADSVEYICPGYSRYCFQLRNEWLVNNSSRVIALWNGKPSGTANTVKYAKKQGVPCVVL